MSATVTVYTTPTCPYCDQAKAFLRSHNVPFVEKDVTTDRSAAIEMIRRSGQQAVPVITADSDVIIGFDRRGLSRIADKFSGPKRPPLGLMATNAEDYLSRHPELADGIPAGTKGVYVGEVRPATVAEKAGIQRGDIIIGLAGKRIRSMSMLDSMVSTLNAGDSVVARILRHGDEQSVTLQF